MHISYAYKYNYEILANYLTLAQIHLHVLKRRVIANLRPRFIVTFSDILGESRNKPTGMGISEYPAQNTDTFASHWRYSHTPK